LAAEGIEAEVLDMPTIKPLDQTLLVDSVRKTGAVVTVEDHNIIGGLASAVAECFMKVQILPEFRGLAVSDVYTESGANTELREKYGVGRENIIQAVKEIVSWNYSE
jgi:transketolase